MPDTTPTQQSADWRPTHRHRETGELVRVERWNLYDVVCSTPSGAITKIAKWLFEHDYEPLPVPTQRAEAREAIRDLLWRDNYHSFLYDRPGEKPFERKADAILATLERLGIKVEG